MNMKRLLASLLSAAVCVSLMTACGNSTSPSNSTEPTDSTQSIPSTEEPSAASDASADDSTPSRADEPSAPAAALHTLHILDSEKHDAITATFFNSRSGDSQEITMEKSGETDKGFTFLCQADTNQYNMVHLTYGDVTTMDVAFNSFTSGWYLYQDALLPYAEGTEPVYDPAYETKVFTFDGYDKTVYIWTPKDYDAKAEDKYATLYLFDGQSVLATGRDKNMDNDVECWNVCENVESMMAVTDHKAIIVAIETVGDRTDINGNTRDDELIPDLGKTVDEMSDCKKHGGLFADFVCDTVMPYVQEHYNVYTDPQHNAIVGSSFGGLASFYTCLAHADRFGVCGALSPSFWVYDEPEWEAFLTKAITEAKELPFLYLYAGGYATDGGVFASRMYDSLLDIYPKDKIVFSKYEAGEHFISFWRNIFPEFLEAFFTNKVAALESGVPVVYNDTSDPYAIDIDNISVDENDSRPAEVRNYIYFDNSDTQWEQVWAFWWDGKPVNIITREAYGADWPGVQMERIEGTDIFRLVAPVGTSNIIFSSGVTDDKVAQGTLAYQTVDMPYMTAMLGKVYKIDTSVEPKAGRGPEKTKFRYSAGEWTDYQP